MSQPQPQSTHADDVPKLLPVRAHAARINTNCAVVAGLLPTRDAIAIQSPNSPYANLIAVRTKDRDDPIFQRLLRAYRSPEVKQWIAERYQGSVVPTW